jgi:predicted transcriptional regulator
MLKKKYKTVSFKVRQLEAMGLIQISRKGKEAGRKWKSFKKVVIL